MANIVIVTGSVRQVNENAGIVDIIAAEVNGRDGLTAQVADLGALNLPFFNAPTSPSAEEYTITDEAVRQWSDMVSKADAVMFVAPEYNHGLSAVQKNAIDWLYSEWNAKVVAYVVYGRHAGVHTLAQLQEISTVVKWKPIDKVVALQFTRDIATDGSLIAAEEFRGEIVAAVDQLVQAM